MHDFCFEHMTKERGVQPVEYTTRMGNATMWTRLCDRAVRELKDEGFRITKVGR